MRKLFLLSLLLLSLSVSAQRIDKPNEPYDVYCTIATVRYSYYTAFIGEDVNEYIILDDDGNKIEFGKLNIVFTFMSKRGWEYVKEQRDGVYILKKTITNDKEAYEGLKLIFKDGQNKGKPKE